MEPFGYEHDGRQRRISLVVEVAGLDTPKIAIGDTLSTCVLTYVARVFVDVRRIILVRSRKDAPPDPSKLQALQTPNPPAAL